MDRNRKRRKRIDVLHSQALVAADAAGKPTCAIHGTLARRPGTGTGCLLHFSGVRTWSVLAKFHRLYLAGRSALASTRLWQASKIIFRDGRYVRRRTLAARLCILDSQIIFRNSSISGPAAQGAALVRSFPELRVPISVAYQ